MMEIRKFSVMKMKWLSQIFSDVGKAIYRGNIFVFNEYIRKGKSKSSEHRIHLRNLGGRKPMKPDNIERRKQRAEIDKIENT